MHPTNIFSEAVLLFVIAVLLCIRDRGSASPSTPYDPLLAGIFFIMSLIRLCEFLGGSIDGHIYSRMIVWTMWLIPAAIMLWLAITNPRADVIITLVVMLGFLVSITVLLMCGCGGYDIIPPDQSVGTSSGIYHWIRTDGGFSFLPFAYYVLLSIALIYLTALSMRDSSYWLLAGLVTFGFIAAAVCVPEILKNPLATLGSVSTLVMLAIGMVAIFMAPG